MDSKQLDEYIFKILQSESDPVKMKEILTSLVNTVVAQNTLLILEGTIPKKAETTETTVTDPDCETVMKNGKKCTKKAVIDGKMCRMHTNVENRKHEKSKSSEKTPADPPPKSSGTTISSAASSSSTTVGVKYGHSDSD